MFFFFECNDEYETRVFPYNFTGRQSAQLVRQYIDCMRMVENSYFKRSGRDSQSDRQSDYQDVYKDMLATSSPPYSQEVWKFLNNIRERLPGKQSDNEDSNWIGYLLPGKSSDLVKLRQTR